MSVRPVHLSLAQVLEDMFIQIVNWSQQCVFPGLTEHLEVVIVQLDSKQLTRVHNEETLICLPARSGRFFLY